MSDIIKECKAAWTAFREKSPLIHNITNYVTVNDVANIELAMGASPIMADDENEAADIASIANALVINIGTLNSRTIVSMIKAGKAANAKGIPVVFDPVGAGASTLRNQTTEKLLSELKMTVIRGNVSEIGFIAGVSASTKGVDVSVEDLRRDKLSAAKTVAEKYGCTVAVTGEVDVITDGTRACEIRNGTAELSRVTGTGCMTTGLLGGFAAVCEPFAAAVCAVASMGIAGELSFERNCKPGTGSFHIGIIDAVSLMDGEIFSERAKINEL